MAPLGAARAIITSGEAAASVDFNLQLMLWSGTGFALQYLDVDIMLLLGAE